MKRFFKKYIYSLARLWPVKKTVVLMYHSIGDNKKFSTVTPKEFERQMAYLKNNGFNVCHLEEACYGEKNVVLTFDDGFKDNYLVAYPILKHYRFPALFFINTARLGTEIITKENLKMTVMSADETKIIDQERLVKIASHCVNHPRLVQLSEEELRRELSDSKQYLEKLLERRVEDLAYPYGSFNETVKRITGEYYKVAYSTNPGWVSNGQNLEVKRNSIDSGVDFDEFKTIVKLGRLGFNRLKLWR